jgi:hypothetical protein
MMDEIYKWLAGKSNRAWIIFVILTALFFIGVNIAVFFMTGCARSQWYRDKPVEECQTTSDCYCDTGPAICTVDHLCQCTESPPPAIKCMIAADCACPAGGRCDPSGYCYCDPVGLRASISIEVVPEEGSYNVLQSPSNAAYAHGTGSIIITNLPLGNYTVRPEALFGFVAPDAEYVQLRRDGEVVDAVLVYTAADFTLTTEPVPSDTATRGTEATIMVVRYEATKYVQVQMARWRLYADADNVWSTSGDTPATMLTDAVRLYDGDTLIADRKAPVAEFSYGIAGQFDAESGDYCHVTYLDPWEMQAGETKTIYVKVTFLNTLDQAYHLKAKIIPCVGYDRAAYDGDGDLVIINGQIAPCQALESEVIEVVP